MEEEKTTPEHSFNVVMKKCALAVSLAADRAMKDGAKQREEFWNSIYNSLGYYFELDDCRKIKMSEARPVICHVCEKEIEDIPGKETWILKNFNSPSEEWLFRHLESTICRENLKLDLDKKLHEIDDLDKESKEYFDKQATL